MRPARVSGLVGLVTVTAVAFAIDAWHLDRDQLGNSFYAAGARSMAHNWHNFFFNSFDPGGFITVDKPPVAQWVDAASVHLFGFNSWGLLLPSAIAGALSVALLWCIVRRCFGPGAATAAGLVLALTPITVSVSRINLPEPFMILALLVAAWAVLRSLDSTRSIPWLVGAGFAVGVAFNTKMLAAYIPLPAMGLVVLLCSMGSFWRKVLHAAVFSATSILASLPWLLIVDATGKAQPALRRRVRRTTPCGTWCSGTTASGGSAATGKAGRPAAVVVAAVGSAAPAASSPARRVGCACSAPPSVARSRG